MRISTVCCARTPNLEIALCSGDFLTAGGALPWRRQDGVCEADGRVSPHTPQTPSAPAPLTKSGEPKAYAALHKRKTGEASKSV